ncbi:hypothetical protein CAPTEDRAFT_192497 [Capitella teleta]|uniref:G-protein coupled receptors family 1 profile domain-containing protein n=1 Tax=Capitella teleta TaxID=283909 RepID=R7URY3_CAPTE|nr:hypothetical protein CAPTEDRAFT_192497 [Capitella teleta]|eukprot:ELU09279.1 hypothetical protein CAPTEDRAFT_192497 [Capitella teleta]
MGSSTYRYRAVFFAGTWVVCCPMLMLVVATLMSSPYNLVAITIIRYMSIRWPLHHTHMLTKRRTYAGMTAVWTAALAISCMLYVRTKPVAHVVDDISPPDVWCNLCRSELHWEFYQTTGMLVFAAVLPFTVMITLYISMSRIYRKHVKAMSANAVAAGEKEDKSLAKREKTLSRVSAFLVGYFFVSYLPFIVYTFTYFFCNCAISGYIRSLVRIILFSNTTVNFFAYIFAHQEFRRGLFRRFCYKKYLEQKRNLSNGSSLNNSDSQVKGSSINTIANNTPQNSVVTGDISLSVRE